MKLLKNRFFIAIVAVALVLCVLPTVLSLTGHKDPVRSALNLIATPFRAVFNWAADGVSGFFDYFSGVDSLLEENERLKAELEEYRQAEARAELAEGENDWLRSQLGFINTYSDYTLLDAKVTGRSSNNYSVTYTLNRGSESGVEVNMAVITPGGVAGYISEVGLGWCRAVALTDPTSAIGVYTSNGIYGTVEGTVDYRQDGYCLLSGLTAELGTETVLYSSGYGNIFPAGLEVGKIVAVEKDEYLHTATYIVEPSVDFDSLHSVFIVTDKTVSVDAPVENGGAG